MTGSVDLVRGSVKVEDSSPVAACRRNAVAGQPEGRRYV